MATGTVKWFAQALHDLGEKIHDLSSDDFRMGIVTAVTAPTKDTVAPHWGGTGTTNFASTQVPVGGTSYTAPVALSGESWTIVSGVPTFRAAVVTLNADASGFTNGAYGIIYNNTDASKRAIAFVEISAAGTASLVAGQLVIDWSGENNDILTLTQA
jgi:hypothetical protein